MTVYSESCNIKYWFDGKPEDSHLCENTITDIDVSALSDGMHSIHMLAESNGKISRIETRYFVKVSSATNESDEQITCKYWFDGMPELSQICENTITDIDVSALSDGMHSIHMLAESNGKISRIETLYFVKVSSETSSLETKCLFFIDDVLYNSYVLNGASEEKIHCDLDVTQITDGIHNLSYYLINNQGKVTRRSSSIFVKTPIGGHGIAKWMYRLNGDKNTDNVKVLKSNVDTLNIVELLSVEPYPIRSSCFEFRVEENKPVLYAKNDIEFWFWDALKNNVGFKKQYVDESVRQELKVDEIAALKSNVVTRVNRPAENEIKWYKFDAEEGDSMVVNVDKACSIDVFSPSGKSVYSAMGAESVKASGTHLYETGTFYVAIHDMTAKYGDEINLNFQLIDKYAVLEYTPKVSGNAGKLFVDLYGNGMLHLDSIQMINNNVILKPHKYCILSNNLVKSIFELSYDGVPIGMYDLKLYYKDSLRNEEEVLLLKEAIKVENCNYGEIKVDYDEVTMWSSPQKVAITITNLGNTTYWGVPFNVAYTNPDKIENVGYNDFYISWSKETTSLVKESVYKRENLLGFGEKGIYIPYIIPKLGPHEKMTLTFDFYWTESSSFQLSAWCGIPWSEERLDLVEENVHSTKKTNKPLNRVNGLCSNYPSAYDVINETNDILDELSDDVLDDAFGRPIDLATRISRLYTGIGEAIGSIYIGLEYQRRQAQREAYGEAYDEYVAPYLSELPPLRHPLNILVDALGIELPGGLEWPDFGTHGDCPQNQPRQNTINLSPPYDPNDIHGYVAESGSKYIGKDVKTINYMIEFENDSTFATSSAHKILLVDTLDVDVLDVTSVVPKSMKIGKHDCDFTKKASGYVATIDMRSEINAIAQISVNVTDKGVMNCEIISLDPMTMEPTDDIMAGILPVNDASGRGQGMLTFMVNLKSGLKDGIEISNKADIIFDSNEPISTPYWINETDYVNPVSKIGGIENVSDTTINIYISGEDERSGIWRYTLYVQPGDGSDWFLAKENIEADTCEYKVYPDINYGFCVVATDKAGNIEEKQLVRGYSYCNGVATSGLQDINLDNSDDKANDETMYDLLGRKVKNPSQGLFVKKKQKVLIK